MIVTDETARAGRPTQTDDLALLHRYSTTGDAEAFQVVVARYQSLVWSACLRILGNASEAEDAVQNVFLTLARSAGSIESNVAAWLHSAAVNCCKSHIRSAAAQRQREQQHGENLVAGDDLQAWKEMREVIDVCLAELNEQDRELVIEHFYRGRTQLEIGKRLGIGQQAVAGRLKKIVEQLRRALSRRGLPVSAAAITGALTAGLTEASVPAHLATTLAQIGIAGIGYTALSTTNGLATLFKAGFAKATITKGLLAAMSVVLGLFVAWFFWGTNDSTLRNVIAQLDNARSIQYTKTRIDSMNGQTEEILPQDVIDQSSQRVLILDGYLERIEDLGPDGTVTKAMVANYRTGEIVWFDMRAKTYRTNLKFKWQLPDAPNPAGLRKLAPQTDVAYGLTPFFSEPVETFAATTPDREDVVAHRAEMQQGNSVWRFTLWEDPESMRPLRTLVTFRNDQPGVGASDGVCDNFVFDAELPRSLFSTEPPAGFKLKNVSGKPDAIPLP